MQLARAELSVVPAGSTLVAQYADACNLFAFMGNDAMARKLDVLKGHCDAVGRDYETIERTILTTANLSAGDDALSRMVKKLRRLERMTYAAAL